MGLRHSDPDRWMELLAEEYYEWLEDNYTMLEIEDGDVISFERWIDYREEDSACHHDELDIEHNFA